MGRGGTHTGRDSLWVHVGVRSFDHYISADVLLVCLPNQKYHYTRRYSNRPRTGARGVDKGCGSTKYGLDPFPHSRDGPRLPGRVEEGRRGRTHGTGVHTG